MNTYKNWRFCRPTNVPGSISLMLLLDRYLRWENKVGLKHLITKPIHLVIFTNVLRFSFSRSNTIISGRLPLCCLGPVCTCGCVEVLGVCWGLSGTHRCLLFGGCVVVCCSFYLYFLSNNCWKRISLYKQNSENGDIYFDRQTWTSHFI